MVVFLVVFLVSFLAFLFGAFYTLPVYSWLPLFGAFFLFINIFCVFIHKKRESEAYNSEEHATSKPQFNSLSMILDVVLLLVKTSTCSPGI